MAKKRVQQPDGTETEIDTPDEPTAEQIEAQAQAAAEAKRRESEAAAAKLAVEAEVAAKAKAEVAAKAAAEEAAAKVAADEAKRRRGVRVVVTCDLEPWINGEPRARQAIVEDVDPAEARRMHERGHVAVIPT